MAWLDNIKHYLYFKRLRFDAKKFAKTPREMLNLNNAKNIGILFNATNADQIMTVTRYAEALSKMGKKVNILAYQNNKDKENTDNRFINKLDVNWYYIPQSHKIDDFHSKNFDILICAFIEDCLPLEYIAATSNARFRVGAFSKAKTNYFELMINTGKNQNLKYLLDQINHFLQVINP